MIPRSLCYLLGALATCALVDPTRAAGQGFPERPIRFIVPYPPGGSLDILARVVSPRMSETYGQPVVIDNRPGAAGNIGNDIAAKAAPDGHTIVTAMNDLIGGQIALMFSPLISAIPHMKAGRARALAVTSPKRVAAVPDVPTMIESGVPNYDVVSWYGVHTAVKAPRTHVDRLNREINRIMSLPEVHERLSGLGMDPMPITPDQFNAMVKAEVAR